MRRLARSSGQANGSITSDAKKQSGRSDKPAKTIQFLNKKYFPTLVAIVFFVSLVVLFWPIDRNETTTLSKDFATKHVKSEAYELGEAVTTQEGLSGERVATYSVRTSLFNQIFGIDGSKKETSSKTTFDPVTKVVAQGTRKYQYMICSDGSYRFYEDDQFKDPNTGFTSKSEDFCKENGQGEMIRLSGTLSDRGAASSARESTVTVRDGCTYTSIPYKTVYRDVSWLNKGETKVSKGSDGTKSSCGWSTDPIDEEILRGTSEPSSGFNPSPNTSTQDTAAYERCLSSYRSAMSQIQASESQGISGQDSLKRQVETEFSRCKRVAGF